LRPASADRLCRPKTVGLIGRGFNL